MEILLQFHDKFKELSFLQKLKTQGIFRKTQRLANSELENVQQMLVSRFQSSRLLVEICYWTYEVSFISLTASRTDFQCWVYDVRKASSLSRMCLGSAAESASFNSTEVKSVTDGLSAGLPKYCFKWSGKLGAKVSLGIGFGPPITPFSPAKTKRQYDFGHSWHGIEFILRRVKAWFNGKICNC